MDLPQPNLPPNHPRKNTNPQSRLQLRSATFDGFQQGLFGQVGPVWAFSVSTWAVSCWVEWHSWWTADEKNWLHDILCINTQDEIKTLNKNIKKGVLLLYKNFCVLHFMFGACPPQDSPPTSDFDTTYKVGPGSRDLWFQWQGAPINGRRNKCLTKWFKSWPFDSLVGRSINLWKGYSTRPSHKGHFEIFESPGAGVKKTYLWGYNLIYNW